MLDKLAPPTDNLYKFIAIAGLVGLVLAVVLIVRQLNIVVDSHFAAGDALYEAWLAVGESDEARELLNEHSKKARDGGQVFGISLSAQEIEELSPDALHAIRAFEIKGETLARQVQINKQIQHYIGYLLGASILVMGLGFTLWYLKTQRYKDAVLQAEAQQQAPAELQSGPANAGAQWTAEEEKKLNDGFKKNMSFKELAKAHGRTRGAIRARLIKMRLIEDK